MSLWSFGSPPFVKFHQSNLPLPLSLSENGLSQKVQLGEEGHVHFVSLYLCPTSTTKSAAPAGPVGLSTAMRLLTTQKNAINHADWCQALHLDGGYVWRASSCLYTDHSDALTHLRGCPPLAASEGHSQGSGEKSRIKVDASVSCAMPLSLNILWGLHRCIVRLI